MLSLVITKTKNKKEKKNKKRKKEEGPIKQSNENILFLTFLFSHRTFGKLTMTCKT